MSIDLLRIDKIPTIKEFGYLLLQVLENDKPMPQYDLAAICKSFSLNFALSFDGSIRFLNEISVIELKDDIIIRKISKDEVQSLQSEHNLCLFLTRRLVAYLIAKDLLANIFNTKVVHYDLNNDSFCIKVNSIPLDYSLIKHFLVNMGIATIDHKSKSRIIISAIYRHFFHTEILQKAINGDGSGAIELDVAKKNEITMSIKSLFISYSHEDEIFKNQLVKHLSGLKRMGLIKEWNDRQILPGMKWDEEIKAKLQEADIILFLISSDFMASDYINDVEIKEAMLRHNKNEALIIPIILRACDFSSLPLGKWQALPKDAKPIAQWNDRDDAYLNVVNGLKKVIHES